MSLPCSILSSPPQGRFVLRIVVDYCNGATQQQIAVSAGVHVQTIRAILREAGVVTREHLATLTRDEVRDLRRMHHGGMSARELGRRFGVAHTTILRHLR